MNLIVDNWCFVMEIECSLLLIFQAIFRINAYAISKGIISEHMCPHIIFAKHICSMLLTVQVHLCDQQGGLTGKPAWPLADGWH